MSDIDEALERLTASAMCTGAVFLLEQAKRGLMNTSRPLGELLGDEPREFLEMRTDLTEPFKPRVLEGDWETVRDALDALPEGAQIRWRTGDSLHVALSIKLGTGLWQTTGWNRSSNSYSIARDGTPIEVIA